MPTPIAIATSTCTYRIEYQRRRCSGMASAMLAELPQRPLPIGIGPGLIRRSSSAACSDTVLASVGNDVLRRGKLLPVTYSLSSLICGFAALLSALAHATSEGRIITLRIAFFIGQPPRSNGLIVLAEGITE